MRARTAIIALSLPVFFAGLFLTAMHFSTIGTPVDTTRFFEDATRSKLTAHAELLLSQAHGSTILLQKRRNNSWEVDPPDTLNEQLQQSTEEMLDELGFRRLVVVPDNQTVVFAVYRLRAWYEYWYVPSDDLALLHDKGWVKKLEGHWYLRKW